MWTICNGSGIRNWNEIVFVLISFRRNIPKTDILPCQGANVYDILRRETLILTRDAVYQLEERLK